MNLKYVLIVILTASIAGGGVLLFSRGIEAPVRNFFWERESMERNKSGATLGEKERGDIKEGVAKSKIMGWGSAINSASEYCLYLGYIIRQEDCLFPDGTSCEQRDFYKGKCGQNFGFCRQQGFKIKTTIEDMGNWTAEYAICVFNDSSECLEEDYIRGDCNIGDCQEWRMSLGGCIRQTD